LFVRALAPVSFYVLLKVTGVEARSLAEGCVGYLSLGDSAWQEPLDTLKIKMDLKCSRTGGGKV
jgi:hypothetical protein